MTLVYFSAFKEMTLILEFSDPTPASTSKRRLFVLESSFNASPRQPSVLKNLKHITSILVQVL